MDDAAILVESIGLCAVSTIGEDHLRALSVELDPDEMHAHLSVTLRHERDDEFMRAIQKLAELELLFVEEASLTWEFEDSRGQVRSVNSNIKQYSFA